MSRPDKVKLWIVVHDGHHGVDVWPEYSATEPDVKAMARRAFDEDEDGDFDDYVIGWEARGPYDVPSTLAAVKPEEKRTYLLQVDSYDGKDTSRNQYSEGDEAKRLFSVVLISPSGAEIVDDGYREIEEAAAAWPNAIVERTDTTTEAPVDAPTHALQASGAERKPGDPLTVDCSHGEGEDCMNCERCGKCTEEGDNDAEAYYCAECQQALQV